MDMSFLKTAALVLVLLLAVRAYATALRRTAHVPGMGYGHSPVLAAWHGAVQFLLRPRHCLLEGYRRYRDGYFKVATLRDEYVLVSDAARITELLSAPVDVLSPLDIADDELQSTWTLGHMPSWHLAVAVERLTANLESMIPGLVGEIHNALDKHMGSPLAHTPVDLFNGVHKIVTQTVSYAFVGHPLCRDSTYLGNTKAFTRAVVVSAEIIRWFPESLKPFVVCLTPVCRRKQIAEDAMQAAVLERLRMNYKEKEKPNDLLQWLVDTAPSDQRNVRNIAERVMSMNVAAIYKTTATLTAAIAHLASESARYTPELRREVRAASGTGAVTQATLRGAPGLDSFIRETGRLHSISMIGTTRHVRRDFRFQDGTLMPAGTRLGVPTVAIHRDELLYAAPDRFDGFRFSRGWSQPRHQQQQQQKQEQQRGHDSKMQAGSTSLDYLTFGHGRQACPGRWFATAVMKLILAVMVVRYDMQPAPGSSMRMRRPWGQYEPALDLRVVVRAAAKG